MTSSVDSLKLIHVKTACEQCRVRELCLPTSLEGLQLNLMDNLVKRVKPLRKGEYLYHTNDHFKGLYAIQSGALKTMGLTAEGREQVTGFHLTGELVGMDAVDIDQHPCNAIALEATEVCLLPFDKLEELGQKVPKLMHELARIMSREILREENALVMLGSTSAEQRLARFLLNLYKRQLARGGDEYVIKLQMTRQDIGNYLGLAFETVSRHLNYLQDHGLLEINNRRLTLLELAELELLAS
ncbi:MAG: fumarate/nitrate reduction transcriptional regulator Fnr [Thioalkalispiraceae bacterium]|jgi:CRP/FNR family transcriptional regulator